MPQVAGKKLTAKECRLIEAALVDRKITKAAVSRQMKRYDGYLFGVLAGKHNPSDAQLKKIADALGLRFVPSTPARIE